MKIYEITDSILFITFLLLQWREFLERSAFLLLLVRKRIFFQILNESSSVLILTKLCPDLFSFSVGNLIQIQKILYLNPFCHSFVYFQPVLRTYAAIIALSSQFWYCQICVNS